MPPSELLAALEGIKQRLRYEFPDDNTFATAFKKAAKAKEPSQYLRTVEAKILAYLTRQTQLRGFGF
jgi:hypothetical protein